MSQIHPVKKELHSVLIKRKLPYKVLRQALNASKIDNKRGKNAKGFLDKLFNEIPSLNQYNNSIQKTKSVQYFVNEYIDNIQTEDPQIITENIRKEKPQNIQNTNEITENIRKEAQLKRKRQGTVSIQRPTSFINSKEDQKKDLEFNDNDNDNDNDVDMEDKTQKKADDYVSFDEIKKENITIGANTSEIDEDKEEFDIENIDSSDDDDESIDSDNFKLNNEENIEMVSNNDDDDIEMVSNNDDDDIEMVPSDNNKNISSDDDDDLENIYSKKKNSNVDNKSKNTNVDSSNYKEQRLFEDKPQISMPNMASIKNLIFGPSE